MNRLKCNVQNMKECGTANNKLQFQRASKNIPLWLVIYPFTFNHWEFCNSTQKLSLRYKFKKSEINCNHPIFSKNQFSVMH